MKMMWCPETATKAYLNTVKYCNKSGTKNLGALEFISAMAAGWKASLIVEALGFNMDGSGVAAAIKNSIGLAIAAYHSGGRHVCIVPNEEARVDYICAMQRILLPGSGVMYSLPEVVVGKAEEVMERLNGVDFLVVHGGRSEDYYGRVLRHAKFGHLGAVIIVLQNSAIRNITDDDKMAFSTNYGFMMRWKEVLQNNRNVVRSRFVPIGSEGIDVAYVAGQKSSCLKNKLGPNGRWIKYIDRRSGEEHLFRR
ncbi:OLC1v1002224C1 [Oldenlandia corymbosa var. corymbosa]|uniref:OLC1v1002224C1 n=1 Tax=Oldenlandia corymbosa var. corymbosa TaxID=529605 RepID=A0AAV1D9Z7_OLDCO|nr:OLC1v1002224C1 [Oldenlandia corymbosa var. corymbosa]